MLYLVGMGLNANQLTREALLAVSKCSKVYLESYTSKMAAGSVVELSKLLKKKVVLLDRAGMEENAVALVMEAKKKSIAVLVVGNPLFATTHDGLVFLAKKKKVKCEVMVGIGIQDYLGVTGLNPYKFGRVVTFVKPQPHFSPESFFDQLMENKELGLHTLCLLDIQAADDYLMSIPEAILLLEGIAKKRGVNTVDWLGVGLAGMGGKKAMVVKDSLASLKKKKWTAFPQCLVMAGTLSPMEMDHWRE